MLIAVSSDMPDGIAGSLDAELRRRGHTTVTFGAIGASSRADWAWSASAAATEVAVGRADQAVVCCWTGTGASIAANKVRGIRAALCTDAYTADGARRWNDANVLALSLRLTSAPLLAEILDAWFAAAPSDEQDDGPTSRMSTPSGKTASGSRRRNPRLSRRSARSAWRSHPPWPRCAGP